MWFGNFFPLQRSSNEKAELYPKAFLEMKQDHLENATTYHWHKDMHIHKQPQGTGARDSLSA